MITMAPLQTLICLILLQLDNASLVQSSDSPPSVYIKSIFLPLTVGQNVTLNCSYKGDIRAKLYWIKQSLDNSQSITSYYFGKREFHNEFANTNRFSLDNDDGKNNLEITNVQISDSAVYQCISCVAYQIQFLVFANVIVKELNSGLRINQRALETVEPGRSLRLDCSVHFGMCDGRHAVHWFKESEESAPGVLYSHGGGDSDQCEGNTDSPTNSCVYSLPIHNVSSEQTGSYYCAVAACGQVLFGNGTKVNVIKDGAVVYVLSGVTAFSASLVVGLTFCLCMKNNAGASKRHSTTRIKGFPKLLQYVASEEVMKKRRGQRDDTWSECTYFSVEQGN